MRKNYKHERWGTNAEPSVVPENPPHFTRKVSDTSVSELEDMIRRIVREEQNAVINNFPPNQPSYNQWPIYPQGAFCNFSTEVKSMNCPYCNNENTENTGRVKYSFPSYSVYKCNNCNKEFDICNNEKIPFYDLSQSINVTKDLKLPFLKSILETGEIPNCLSFQGRTFYLFRVYFDYYYYKREDKDNFMYLQIDKKLVEQADYLSEQIQDFYDNIKEIQ